MRRVSAYSGAVNDRRPFLRLARTENKLARSVTKVIDGCSDLDIPARIHNGRSSARMQAAVARWSHESHFEKQSCAAGISGEGDRGR